MTFRCKTGSGCSESSLTPMGDDGYCDRCWAKNKAIEKIQGLRDADEHHCPADEDDREECTCNKYDELADFIRDEL